MQDIRDSGLNANNKICFEVRATALRPRLHTEGFPLIVHTGLPTQETSTEDLDKYNLGVHNSSLNKYNLSLEARHKANTKSTSQLRDRHKAKQPPLTRGSRHLAN